MKPLLLVLLLGSTLSLQAQRNVHWIHGLGGAATSWQQFSNEFGDQRQMPVNTHNAYQTGNGVNGMVTDIQNQIGGQTGGTALGICHSILRWLFLPNFAWYNWVGNGWSAGYDYLNGQSENEWANLIGSGYSYTQQVTSLQLIGNDLGPYSQCVTNANNDPTQLAICENEHFIWVTQDVTFFVRDQTDGLVPRRSQIGENTAWANSNSEIRELSNNNHNEMRRSNESRNEIIEAFNGNRSNGAFFVPPI